MPEPRGSGKLEKTTVSQLRRNRLLVFVSAAGCILIGIAIAVLDSTDNIWCGSFIRAGLVMGAFWVAMPTPKRPAAWAGFNPWWIPVIVVVMLVVVRRPQVMVPFAAAFFALMVLMPLLTTKLKR